MKNADSYNFLLNNKYSFIDVTVVDNLEKRNRFLLTYNFINLVNNSRIFLNSRINLYSTVPTLSNAFKGAIPAEREVYDMYGVFFQDMVIYEDF